VLLVLRVAHMIRQLVCIVAIILGGTQALSCETGPLVPNQTVQLMPPIEAPVTATFGVMKHPILQIDRQHSGIDYSAAVGAIVATAAPGKIVAAGRNAEFGLQVVVEHVGGLTTSYSHLSRFDQQVGACISFRQVVGAVGNTGLSATPHLHFEVLHNGIAIDPLTVLSR
jgi:murein DD-endopeptidase MepM/ murein hydrolase activator NlpD